MKNFYKYSSRFLFLVLMGYVSHLPAVTSGGSYYGGQTNSQPQNPPQSTQNFYIQQPNAPAAQAPPSNPYYYNNYTSPYSTPYNYNNYGYPYPGYNLPPTPAQAFPDDAKQELLYQQNLRR